MPFKTWWAKTLAAIYIAGFWFYFLGGAIQTWPRMSFMDWWGALIYQCFYAMFWPITLLLNASGVIGHK